MNSLKEVDFCSNLIFTGASENSQVGSSCLPCWTDRKELPEDFSRQDRGYWSGCRISARFSSSLQGSVGEHQSHGSSGSCGRTLPNQLQHVKVIASGVPTITRTSIPAAFLFRTINRLTRQCTSKFGLV